MLCAESATGHYLFHLHQRHYCLTGSERSARILTACLAMRITTLDELCKSCRSVPFVASLIVPVLGLRAACKVEKDCKIGFQTFAITLLSMNIKEKRLCTLRFKGFL